MEFEIMEFLAGEERDKNSRRRRDKKLKTKTKNKSVAPFSSGSLFLAARKSHCLASLEGRAYVATLFDYYSFCT